MIAINYRCTCHDCDGGDSATSSADCTCHPATPSPPHPNTAAISLVASTAGFAMSARAAGAACQALSEALLEAFGDRPPGHRGRVQIPHPPRPCLPPQPRRGLRPSYFARNNNRRPRSGRDRQRYTQTAPPKRPATLHANPRRNK